MSGLVTRVSYWPEGCDPSDPNARGFRVDVEWTGPRQEGARAVGGYRVVHGASELSRTGGWTFYAPRFRRWQHRWATIEEAQRWAAASVDSVLVNGRTWAEWQAHFAAKGSS